MTWSICVARQTDLSAALINHTWNRLSVVSRIALQDLATLFLSKDAISCLFAIFADSCSTRCLTNQENQEKLESWSRNNWI